MSDREWNADVYHWVSEPQYAWGLRVLNRLALRGSEHVLDAGCGTGRLTAALVARLSTGTGTVVGVDLSSGMTSVARGTLAILGYQPRSDVVCADLLALPFGAHFDVVYSTATFHWVLDHDALWRSLYSVLVPGGVLEAQCGGGGNLERVHSRATQLTASSPYAAYFSSWTSPWEFASAETTEARLVRAGFNDVRCWIEETPTTFADTDTYRVFMKTVVMRPYLARLPDHRLQEQFLDTMTELAERDDPPLTLDYWRLNIHAARR